MRAYGIALRGEQVLLVRSSSPLIDPPLWWLPGGGIDFAESPVETLAREFEEETGLAAHDPVLFDVLSDVRRRPNGDRVHAVRIIYRVRAGEGELRDEVDGTTDRAQWFALSALDGVNLADFARRALHSLASK
ncbi:MAG TPA: NUDIX domain-containing protein [Acidimicrobiales bacterium]|nr:NUDIX domain-containing protein [Acidimicrobiales bacterium]